MTQDEKIIWAAVFAAVQVELNKISQWTRSDLAIEAAKQADYTIAAIRRV